MGAGGACRGLPRLRETLVRDAARVDDGDVARRRDLAVAVAEQPLAQRLGVGLRDLAAEKADGEARHRAENLLTHVQIRRPAARLDAALAAVALELGLVRDEVAGRDRPGGTEPRPERDDRVGGDVRQRQLGLGQLVLAQVGLTDLDGDTVVGRVPLGRLDGLGIEVEGPARARSRASRPRSRARPSRSRRRARSRVPRARAAAGRAASSDGRRCRRRGPGRSRPRSRPRPGPPRAGRSRASRRGPACGTGASGPASPPRRRRRQRRRTPARSAPRRRRSCTPRARVRRHRPRAPRIPQGRARA